MDTISNFLTTIRNAYAASHADCTCLCSRVHLGIAKVLKAEGVISDYEELTGENGIKKLKISLKYVDDAPAIIGIERISTPGVRTYCGYQSIPKILGGMGFVIITTPKGIMTGRLARKEKLGGELICKVW
jgi:small subunit ribosomal protein S8